MLYSGVFPLGTDAVRLAAFANLPKGAAVCDLCAGSGAVGLLMLAREPSLSVTAVELREEACALMECSVTESGIKDRFRVLRGDIRAIRDLLPAGSFRYVALGHLLMLQFVLDRLPVFRHPTNEIH